ncbi:MAG TPA: hypothetical protein VMH23_16515 [Bacteroidota bacterium]|nr:hypothetical protein [Bacteroidota bacterium]
MSETEEQRLFHVIPPEESKCDWMTAGVLSYQLCDRKYECDECPVDVAMRQRVAERDGAFKHERRGSSAKPPEESRVGVVFGRKHLWLKRIEAGKLRLGIEPGMASVLVPPMAIVLPAPGARIERSKACAWIVLDGGTLPMISPVSGTVTQTNSVLVERPHDVSTSPLDEGWLFEMTVEEAEFVEADILPLSDVARIYAEDERPLRSLLEEQDALSSSETAGRIPEHGRAIERLSARLGPTEYLNLLRAMYT